MPFVFSAQVMRKPMSCQPTGVMQLGCYYGTPPYYISITGAPAYTGPRNFTISSSTYTMNNIPAGTYTITATDGCLIRTENVTVSTLTSDVPTGISFSLERASVNTCNTLRQISNQTISPASDWTYYWQNFNQFYEIAYSTTSSPVANNWQTPSSLSSMTFNLPGDFQNFCATGGNLYIWMRPKGCPTSTPALIPATISPKICNYNTIDPFEIIYLGADTCGNQPQIYFDNYIGLCYYPTATWVVTQKNSATVLQSGAYAPASLATNSLLLKATDNTHTFQTGVTYVITLTDNLGRTVSKEFTIPAIGSGAGFSYNLAGNNFVNTYSDATCFNCYINSASITVGGVYPNPTQFKLGTTFTYVGYGTSIGNISSVGAPMLPWGVAGTTITSKNNENFFRINIATPLATSPWGNCPDNPHVRIPNGYYRFQIIEPCFGTNTILNVLYTQYAYNYQVNLTRGCAKPGITVSLTSTSLYPWYYSYFQIIAGPDPAMINQVTQTGYVNGTTHLFPNNFVVPGKYTAIQRLSTNTTSAFCTYDTLTFEIEPTILDYDRDNIFSYRCSGSGDGVIGVRGIYGMPHPVNGYTYTLYSDVNHNTLATTYPSTPNPNNVGDFVIPNVHAGEIYYIKITDNCNESISFPLVIYSIKDVDIIKSSGDVFCREEIIELSAFSLGENNTYKWTFADGTVKTGQNISITSSAAFNGYCVLEISLSYCSNEVIRDSVLIQVHEAVPNPIPTNSSLILCEQFEYANLEVLAGLTPTTGLFLVWYDSPTATVPIAAPTNFLLYPARNVTFYVAQESQATGCSSNRVPITVNIGGTPATAELSQSSMCVGNTTSLNITAGGPLPAGCWYSTYPDVATVNCAGTVITGVSSGIASFYFKPSGPGCEISTKDLVVYNAAYITYSGGEYCNNTATTVPAVIYGTTGGSFTVSPPTGLYVHPASGLITITPGSTLANTYTITYHPPVSAICQTPATATVKINAPPSGNLTYSTSSFCEKDNMVYYPALSVLPGQYTGFYSVSPTTGLSIDMGGGIKPDESVPGNYVVKYTIIDNNGCGNVDLLFPLTIGGGEAVTIKSVYVATRPTCTTSGSIQVHVTGGSGNYEYRYNGGTFSVYPNGEITDLTAGNYYIEVRDADFPTCPTSTSGDIMLRNGWDVMSVSVSAVNSTSCSQTSGVGQLSVSVSGGTAPYSYYVNGVYEPALTGIGGTLFGLGVGEYVVEVVDGLNCKASGEKVRISSTTSPLTMSHPTPTSTSCGMSNATATVAVFSSNYSYQLNNGEIVSMTTSTVNLSGLSAGTHTLRVFDDCGELIQPIYVENSTGGLKFLPVVTHETVSCTGILTPGKIRIVPEGGLPPYQYRIDGGAWISITGSDTTIIATEGLYSIEIKDDTQCIYEITRIKVTLEEYKPVNISSIFAAVEPTCTTLGAIQIYPTGGSGSYQYSINDGPYYTYPDGKITGLKAGNYYIKVQDASSSTCGTALSGNIMLRNAFGELSVNVSVTNSSTCTTGAGDGTLDINVLGGELPFTFALNGTPEPSLNGYGGILTGLEAGEYLVEVKDKTGCVATSEKVRISSNLPALTVSDPALTHATCALPSGSANFTVSGVASYSYQLNNSDIVSATGGLISLSGLVSGWHTLRVFNNCTEVTKLFKVGNGVMNLDLIAEGTPEELSCTGILTPGKIKITPNGGFSPYQFRIDGGLWINITGIDTTLAVSEGIYTIEIKDAIGCTFEANRIGINRNTLVCDTHLELTLFLQGVTQSGPIMTTYLQGPSRFPGFIPDKALPKQNPFTNQPEFYHQINEATGPAGKVVDWILVEILTNFETFVWGDIQYTYYDLIESQALLLKPEGTVVDTNGKRPRFNTYTAGSVRIAVKARNHLSILSSALLPLDSHIRYNFSDSETKAFKITWAPYEPTVLRNGVWCLYAGDIWNGTPTDASINIINATDVERYNTKTRVPVTWVLGTYMFEDVNMDAMLDGGDDIFIYTNARQVIQSPLLYFIKR